MNDRFHNIAWPAAIVLLLLSSVAMMAAVVVAARSDGGAQVVEDYYNRAVAWDSLAAARTESADRGWLVEIDIAPDGRASLSVSDSTYAPVTDLEGEVEVGRPQFANPLGRTAVSADPDRAGVYTFDIEAAGRGIWIFDITLMRDDLLHVVELRTRAEIR